MKNGLSIGEYLIDPCIGRLPSAATESAYKAGPLGAVLPHEGDMLIVAQQRRQAAPGTVVFAVTHECFLVAIDHFIVLDKLRMHI